MDSTALVAYLVLFVAVALLFVFAGLLLGRFLRARAPTPEKLEIYECGEPPIGSGYLQFDLRFYVVALVFIIFEVEVAFFFPWAVVFGKAAQLGDPRLAKTVPQATAGAAAGPQLELSPAVVGRLRELGVREVPALPPGTTADQAAGEIERGARRLALTAMIDLSAFFAVLLVGFAYVWHRGDLDWVRAIARPTPPGVAAAPLERGDG